MGEKTSSDVSMRKLLQVLSKVFSAKVIHADYEAMRLHGGDVGFVQLITGEVKTADSENLPFRIVLKIQKKWERYGDPDSWRREYDLYASGLGGCFPIPFAGRNAITRN